tara:strand:- start:1367 stop:3568 length:2202 start_codon:yes stop_codon:yes gene_type:complete
MTKDEIKAILEAQKSIPDIGSGMSLKDLEVMDNPRVDLGATLQKQILEIRQKAPEQGLDPEDEVKKHLVNTASKFDLNVEALEGLIGSKTLDTKYGMGKRMLDTLTFGASDELEALAKSLFGKNTYDQNLAQLSLAKKMFDVNPRTGEQDTRASTAADVAALAMQLPVAAKSVSGIIDKLIKKPENLTFGKKLLAYGGSGTGLGAGQGALTAIPGERKVGAQSAAALSGALSVGGPLVAKTAELTPLPKMIERGVGSIFGNREDIIKNQADLEVLARLKRDTGRRNESLDDLISKLNQQRPNVSMMDRTLPVRINSGGTFLDDKPVSIPDIAGAETRGLAAYTARYPGSISKAEQFLAEREGGQGIRIMKDFAKNVKVDKDAYDLKQAYLNDIENKAKPLYRALNSSEEFIYSDELNNVMKAPAFRQIYEDYRANEIKFGLSNPPPYSEILKDPGRGLNMEGANFFKKGLDSVLRPLYKKEKNPNVELTQAETMLKQGAQDLRNRYMKALDEVAPEEYKQARKLYVDKFDAEQAMEMGFKNLLNNNTSAKEFASMFKKIKNPQAKEAFKVGIYDRVRQTIDTALENESGGVNVLNKLYRNQQIKEKYEAVLGKDEYADLMKRLDTELSIKQTDRQIAGGSITQPKLLEDSFFRESKVIDPMKGLQDYIIRSVDTAPEKAERVTEMLLELDYGKQLETLNRLKELDSKIYDEVIKRFGMGAVATTTANRPFLED